jgi:hypothetical protein
VPRYKDKKRWQVGIEVTIHPQNFLPFRKQKDLKETKGSAMQLSKAQELSRRLKRTIDFLSKNTDLRIQKKWILKKQENS